MTYDLFMRGSTIAVNKSWLIDTFKLLKLNNLAIVEYGSFIAICNHHSQLAVIVYFFVGSGGDQFGHAGNDDPRLTTVCGGDVLGRSLTSITILVADVYWEI